MKRSTIFVHRAWRAELPRIATFAALCLGCVILSRLVPESVIQGRVFSLAGITLTLSLPLFAIVPFFSLVDLLIREYDVGYLIDERGIEARVGIVSLRFRVSLIRFEDVRLVEIKQSILGRILNFGNIEIGTAARDDIEVIMEGVANPAEIQEMIQSEREKRKRLGAQRTASAPAATTSAANE